MWKPIYYFSDVGTNNILALYMPKASIYEMLRLQVINQCDPMLLFKVFIEGLFKSLRLNIEFDITVSSIGATTQLGKRVSLQSIRLN